MIRTVVKHDLTVVIMDIEDHEIPGMIDSGYVSAVMRQTDDGIIEYAAVDWKDYSVVWLEPQPGSSD